MPLSLRPITVADLPAVSRLRVTAFEDMPAARVMRPGPVTPEVIAWSSERTEKYFKERSNIFVGVFDDDLAQLVAYAQWELIDAEARAEPEVEPVWPSFMNREALQEFWGSYEKVRKETMGSQDYLALGILVTNKAQQRRGAGSMLLQWGQRKAREERLPIWLDATEAGKPLYTKNGFEIRTTREMDLSKYGTGVDHLNRNYSMVWTPGPHD